MENLLDTDRVAEILGKPNASALRSQIRRNPNLVPPFQKVGKHLMWRESDVRKWLDEQFSMTKEGVKS